MKRKRPAGFAIWLTGRPAAGKSTLARQLRQLLAEQGIQSVILDSDELRTILTPQPAYGEEERNWFYQTLGLLAALLVKNGVNVLVAATAHRRHYRQRARTLIERFAEVYVDCPPEICRRRDPKGLYAEAAANLPGAGIAYEAPLAAEAVIDTSQQRPGEAAVRVMQQVAGPLALFGGVKEASIQDGVAEWMTRDPIAIEGNMTLLQAYRLMQALGVRHLPVVEQRALLGIISLSDIRQAEVRDAVLYHEAELEYVVAQARTVGELVRPATAAVSPQTTIGEAARLILDYRLTAVPVLDEAGQLVGILTESDIFDALVQNRMSRYQAFLQS